MPNPHHLTDTERTALTIRARDLYTSGLSLRRIAQIVGHSYSTIHYILSHDGMEFRPRGGPNHSKQPPTGP